jgi:hypothetical protein
MAIDLSQYQIVHAATHSTINYDHPSRSRIWLSADTSDTSVESYISLDEVAQLKLSADLVVLSSCESGGGDLDIGDGMNGFVRALMSAGTRNVVVSLWEVEDFTTAAFMKSFYENLGMGYADALRASKMEMISSPRLKHRHPFYWSSAMYRLDRNQLAEQSCVRMIVKTILVIILTACLPLHAQNSEEARLSKTVNSLDDFYYSYVQLRPLAETLADGKMLSTEAVVSGLYRDAFVYELIKDTLWIKVFITTDERAAKGALEKFRSMRLRALSQFGNIFAAKIRILQLPEIDKLSFVRSIEPVVPDGTTARASLVKTSQVEAIKKK